jgi:predicted transcriptional regulator
VQPLLVSLEEDDLIHSVGEGKKGDPKKWFANIESSGLAIESSPSVVPFCPLVEIVATEPLVEQKAQEVINA